MTDRLNDLVQITRRAVKKIVSRKTISTFSGYNYCETENDKWAKELRHVIEKLRDQSLEGDVCLCDDEVDKIEAHIHRLTYECKVGDKDFTKEESPTKAQWLLANPYCLAYEYTADYLASLCKRIKLDFKVIEQRCQDIDIEVKISDKSVCDAIDISLQVEEQTCPSDVLLNVDLHQCVVDLQVIASKTNCEVDLQTYLTLLNCNVSVDTIVNALNCGATVSTLLTEVDCGVNSPIDGVATEIIPIEFDIRADDQTVCYYTDIVLSLENETNPDTTYVWDFGGATPSSGTGEGPFTIQYTTAGSKTVTVTANAPHAEEVVETLPITVSTCTGNITGTVKDHLGAGLQRNVRLYADLNADGVKDDAVILRQVLPVASGAWSMVGLTPGSYILEVVMLGGETLISAQDTTPSGNLAPDISTTDNLIPVTVYPGAVNNGNNFIVQT